MAGGIDLFARQSLATSYVSYNTQSIGTNLRLGFALSEELSFQPHYSIYQQKITLPDVLNDCLLSPYATQNGGPGVSPTNEALRQTGSGGRNDGGNCLAKGDASLPARMELAPGPALTSLGGYTLAYSTLDNNKSPPGGLYASIPQDVAGVGGDVNFL